MHSSMNSTSVSFKQKELWNRIPFLQKSSFLLMSLSAQKMSLLWGLLKMKLKFPTMMEIFQIRSRLRGLSGRECFKTQFLCSVLMEVFIKKTRRITTIIKFYLAKIIFWGKRLLNISKASFCSTSQSKSLQTIFRSHSKGWWEWWRNWCKIWPCLTIWTNQNKFL